MKKLLSPVTKVVSDYSAEELLHFREQFAPVAQNWDKHNRRIKICTFACTIWMIIGIIIIILGSYMKIFPEFHKGEIKFLLLLWCAPWFFPVYVFLRQQSRLEKCPACLKHLLLLGNYCPECGSNQLEKEKWSWPKCNDCGKDLKLGKRRKYKIRFCPHCGVFLDEKGVQKYM